SCSVARRNLRGPANSPAIMGKPAVTVVAKEQQLSIPRVGAQASPVYVKLRGAVTPVLVVDLRAVVGDKCGHVPTSSIARLNGPAEPVVGGEPKAHRLFCSWLH